jgi:hypothetical protein
VEQADASAAPETQSDIDAWQARIGGAASADDALTNAIAQWLQTARWRAWPVIDRVRTIGALAELAMRGRSALAGRIYPGLADMFRSTLTEALHVGFAAQLYDHLRLLRWISTEDISDLVGFRDEAVAPLSRHAQAWAARTHLPSRRTIGDPPYRVAYLSRNSRLAAGDAVARATLSLLRGHARLASDRFRFHYYAWLGIGEDYQRELEALGVTVRVQDWSASPCAAIARLRGALEADRIDVLLTDGNFGVPTTLFASRAAPVQAFLDMGFAAWDTEQLDHTFLHFFSDERTLGVPVSRVERLEHRYDAQFVQTHADATQVKAQRARFQGTRHVFGFVGRLFRPSPDYFTAIRAILTRVPDSMMYVGGADVGEILSGVSFGDLGSRVIVDAGAVDSAVMLRAIDTVLDPMPSFDALATLQALAAGRPIVHLADARPGFTRLQELARDHQLQAATVDDYIALASRLATDAGEWAARSQDTIHIVARATDTAAMAAQVEAALDQLIRQRQNHHA